MKVTFFSLLIVILTFSSCNNLDTSNNDRNEIVSGFKPYKVDLEKSINNVKSVPLSSIGKKIEYIPLETNSECLIRRIDQIAFSDSFIFISDFTKLLQFNRNGSFVRQIGSIGRGPGEYINIWDVCIDNKKEIIYILSSRTRTVLAFDFNGKFINSFGYSFHSQQFILRETNRIMFHMVNRSIPTHDTVYSWYITDTEGVILSRIRNCLKREMTPEYLVMISPLYIFNETVHFMDFGIDTLYFFNNSKKEPYAILNLGDLKMDIEPDITTKEARDKLDHKFWFYTIIEDEKNLYINLSQGGGGPIVPRLFNKITSEVAFPENGGFLNDLDGGPVFWPREIYNDSILIDYIDSFKLLDFINAKLASESREKDRSILDQFEALRNQLTETSNPVLMVVK